MGVWLLVLWLVVAFVVTGIWKLHDTFEAREMARYERRRRAFERLMK